MSSGRKPRIDSLPIAKVYTIGQAARATALSPKMIRHYETLKLIAAPQRTTGNYRLYSEKSLHELRFIKRARSLGFSMSDLHKLLGLWRNTRRSSSEVKRLTQRQVAQLDQRIAELQSMRATLMQLIDCCHGDERPECPILDDFAS